MRTSNLILAVLAAVIATGIIVNVFASVPEGSAGADLTLAGIRAERDYDALPLRHLRVSGPISVILSAGVPDVRIEADEALLDHLGDADPDPDVLALRLPRGTRLPPGDRIVAHVSTPTLERISLSGSAGVSSPAALSFARVALNTSGNCSADLHFSGAQALEVASSGSADIGLRGTAHALSAGFSGAGDLDAGRLAAQVVRINSSGNANSVVHADSLLVVASSGSGTVGYYGQPRVDFKNSGSGRVRAL